MSIGRLGLAILLGLAGTAVLVQPGAAQTNVTALNHCGKYLTEGPGAFWGNPTNLKWGMGNAIWLCQGAQDTATPPGAVQCFNGQMATGVNWATAIANCRQARGQDPSTAAAVYAALEAEMRALQVGGSAQPAQGPVPAAGMSMSPQQWQLLQQQQAQPQPQPQAQPQQQTAQAPQDLSIAFSNPLNTPVDQFLFMDGQYTHYYTLQPGQTIDQPSSPGLEWVFSVQGQTRGNYVTTSQPGQAYVIGTASVATAPVAPQQPVQPQQPFQPQQPQGTPQGAPQAVAALAADARTVSMVEYSSGAFVRLAGNYWGEVSKADFKIAFVFEEVSRDPDAIRLRSPLDGKNIALDLPDRKIYWGYDSAGGAVNPLYDITATASRSRIPGSALAWENQSPPAGTLPQQAAVANVPANTPASSGAVVQTQPQAQPQTTPAAGGTQMAGIEPATGLPSNVPSKAFAADMYTEEKMFCTSQDAKHGPGQNMMTQTLGSCSPIRTQAGEFVMQYRLEDLTRGVNFSGGAKLTIFNYPIFSSWIEKNGSIHLVVGTEQNTIGIEGATRTKQKQGPFMRTMNVKVTPGIAMKVIGTYPLNGMGTTMASRSKGYNVSANVGANVGSPMASGLNAGMSAGYSDTTTASYSLGDFKVEVARLAGEARSFNWKLCAWEGLTSCYKSGTDLLVRGFLGGLENELINAPESAFRMDGFKSDVHYSTTDVNLIRQMSTTLVPIIFDYDIVVNSVVPASNDGGFTRYGKTTSNTITYRMVFNVDMRELAQIALQSPRFGYRQQ